MIKFSSDINGKPTVGFGLSEENICKLKEGQPIFVAPEDMKNLIGVECSIVILYGKTEKDIVKVLEPLITPDTNIIS